MASVILKGGIRIDLPCKASELIEAMASRLQDNAIWIAPMQQCMFRVQEIMAIVDSDTIVDLDEEDDEDMPWWSASDN